MFKKKGRQEDEYVFRINKIVIRFPGKDRKADKDREDWRKAFREKIQNDLTIGIRAHGEEIKSIKEEEIKRQCKMIKEDIEGMKEKFKEREER